MLKSLGFQQVAATDTDSPVYSDRLSKPPFYLDSIGDCVAWGDQVVRDNICCEALVKHNLHGAMWDAERSMFSVTASMTRKKQRDCHGEYVFNETYIFVIEPKCMIIILCILQTITCHFHCIKFCLKENHKHLS